MNKSNSLLFVFLIISASLFPGAQSFAAINFGVQAPRSHLSAEKKWKDLGVYLSKQLGEQTNIVPLHPAETLEAVRDGKVEVVLSNPVLALRIQKKLGGHTFATLKRHSGSQFAGVIVSKKGTGIKKSADLKNKFVLSYKFKKSAAAYVFQVKHLLERGINPHKDFRIFREVRSTQDVIINAVDRGLVDAGFVKSGLLEEMQKEGRIRIDDFNIIDKVPDDFPHIHTTKLYPEWSVTAAKGLSLQTVKKIKRALLELTPTDKPCQSAKVAGFVELVNFSELEDALRTLKLPPFN